MPSPGVACAFSPHSPPPQPRFLFDMPGASYLDRVVAEILETERTYVHDLQDIIKGYLVFISSRQGELHLVQTEVDTLFGNIVDIHDFNSCFLEFLQSADSDPVRLAQCFVDKNQGFLIYTDYCTNYPGAVDVLTQWMRNPVLADALKSQQMALQHGLPLGSYLLKPVQRILKYHLLLQNIMNNYDKARSGLEVIQTALDSMTKMADHINEMKRKHEHRFRIQEIQSILYGWDGDDLTTYGDLILEDTFRMYGAKGGRQLLLFEKGILIAKKKEDGTLMAKASIRCSNLMLIESIPKEPLSFHVIPFNNPRMQYTVQARTLEQKRRWCQELKRLILDNYSANIPAKAKQLVMMLGKSREEQDYEENQAEPAGDTAKKQHTAPEYLEKRRGRRKSASFIPDFALLKSKRAQRKSEAGLVNSSPKSSPRLRRRSDMTAFQTPCPDTPRQSGDGILETDERGSSSRSSQERDSSESPALSQNALHMGGRLGRTRTHSRSLGCLASPAWVRAQVAAHDDASARARQLSRSLQRRGLSALTFDTAALERLLSRETPKSDHVFPARSPRNLATYGMRKPESFRIATEVNRMDSVRMAEELRQRFRKQASAPGSLPGQMSVPSGQGSRAAPLSPGAAYPIGRTPEEARRGTTPSSDADYMSAKDFYSNVLYLHKQRVLGKGKALATDAPPGEECGDYVKLQTPPRDCSGHAARCAEDDDCYGDYLKLALGQGTDSPRIIANEHARSTDTLDGAGVSPSPMWDLGGSQLFSGSRNSKASSGVYDNWRVGQCDDVTTMAAADGDISAGSSPSKQATRAGRASAAAALMGDLGASLSSLTAIQSYVTDATPAVRDSTYVGGARPLHQRVKGPSDSIPTCDHQNPWVPRAEPPCCLPRHLYDPKEVIMRPDAGGDRKPKVKRSSKLVKSQSFNSEDDLLDELSGSPGDGGRNRSGKGHRRRVSETAVFSNRTAFLASAASATSPVKIRLDPELQRRLARLATPPRDLGPEMLLQEIARCRERGKVVSRYATPPRSLMESPSEAEGWAAGATVLANSLHSDLLDTGRGGLPGGSPGGCGSSGVVGGCHGGKAGVGSASCSSPPPLAPPPCGSPAAAEAVWSDLEDYLKATSPDEDEGGGGGGSGRGRGTTPRFPQPVSPTDPATPCSPGPPGLFIQRPGSFHGTTVHSTSCAASTQRPRPSTSPAPGESIVDSLKHALHSLTSKLRLRSPGTPRGGAAAATRSLETSPTRPTIRARSAEDMYRVCHLDNHPHTPEAASRGDKLKDKKQRLVKQIARVYSDRVRSKHRPWIGKRSKSRDGERDRDRDRDESPQCRRQGSMKAELRDLLKENQQGGQSVGARMATTKPVVLGAYTLTRHRPARPQPPTPTHDPPEASCHPHPRPSSPIQTVTHAVIEAAQEEDMNCEQAEVEAEVLPEPPGGGTVVMECDEEAASSALRRLYGSHLGGMSPALHRGGRDVSGSELRNSPRYLDHLNPKAVKTADESNADFFYEDRLVKDLERSSMGSLRIRLDSPRDNPSGSAAGDPDTASGVDTDPSPFLKMSIRETVRLIEQRCRAKQVSRLEVKRKEKARGIQEILKTLEAQSGSPACPGSPIRLDQHQRVDPLSGSGTPVAAGSLTPVTPESPVPLKSIRERTRELVECATLTRIRQNSYSIDPEYKTPSGDERDGRGDAGADDGEGHIPEAISPTRRGWLRH